MASSKLSNASADVFPWLAISSSSVLAMKRSSSFQTIALRPLVIGLVILFTGLFYHLKKCLAGIWVVFEREEG